LKEELKNINPATLASLDTAMDQLQGPLPPEELIGKFDRTTKGEVKQTRHNCVLVFRHDQVLYGKIRFNKLS